MDRGYRLDTDSIQIQLLSIGFTIFIRIVTLPLTLKQMHSTRMMAAIGPHMQDIQKRFKDPKRRSDGLLSNDWIS